MTKKTNEQGTLFQVDKVRRKRKPHKRVSRTKEVRIQAYRQVLMLAKMKEDNNESYNLKDFQIMCNTGKFPASLLPDLKGMSKEELTIAFTTEWYNGIISPYYKRKNDKAKKVEVEDAQPVEVEAAPQGNDSRPIKVILDELKAELIKTIDNKFATLMAF